VSEPAADHRELEFKLLVVGGDVRLLEEMAGVERLGAWGFRPAGRRVIRDRYFDTASGALRSAGASLRLRVENGTAKITLKSDREVQSGLFSRREVESVATPNFCRTIARELADVGVSLSPVRQGDDPSTWFRSAGLVLIQDRSTERVALLALWEGFEMAEVALDTTTYHLRTGDQTIREVELESLGAAEGDELRALAEVLMAAFPGQLEPSSVGKLRRGLDLGEPAPDA
jgi:inorganic triphosphatase YgiF